jgi:DNA helicase-2/ATP-dependent DNA helicase PcrA
MGNSVKLTNQQKEAIQEINRNLQIIACAGSGKTEVITRRIANILQSKTDITPQNIVAFTFTEKAAASMKQRIAKALNDEAAVEGMYIGTIHGFCYHLLNKYTEQFKGHKILDTVKSHLFVARYHNECGMSDLKLDPYPRNVNLFLSCIEKMIDDYDNHEQWSEEHEAVFEKYKISLYSRGYIDFALLIFEAIEQLRNNELAKQFLQTIKYLVVDEYQDVDDLQEKLISIIADAGANVCVVGDDDQTIYQFRGSNANNMILFPERYHDVHQVRLETNFRCSHGVVDIADCVIRNNNNRIAKKMIANGDVERTEIVARRFDSRADEYAWIAEKAAELHQRGIPYLCNCYPCS